MKCYKPAKPWTGAIGRKLAARVLRSWTEDFVDEDTGEVVTIERNEIILERDTVLDEENISYSRSRTASRTSSCRRKTWEWITASSTIRLQKDPSSSEMEAVQYIYRQLRVQ
jgi:DNA-directed RNA polymerase subunit beta